MLRNCMFINGTLTNSECWYNVNKKHLETLESGDLMLIRKLIKGHSKTAKEAFYLETGLLPTKFIIQKRKLMFLWNILQRNENELVKKVYNTQNIIATTGVWAISVKDDRIELGITETDEEISKMPILRFRSIVDKAVEKTALKVLNDIANDPKRSKSRNLIRDRLQCQEYFFHKSFHRSDIELLFSMRTRMINLKKNFPSLYKDDISCTLCKVQVECQEHLLKK